MPLPQPLLDFLPLERTEVRSNPLVMELSRELGEGDLALLEGALSIPSKTPQVSRLRHGHHMMARLLAEGRKAVEVSQITGYSQSRISILQGDPAFGELVEYYKAQVQEVFLNVHERLASLGMQTIEELQDRLDVEPGRFSNRELFEMAELALDRSIAPPKGGKAQGLAPGPAPSITINFVHPEGSGPTGPTIEGRLE